jgi:hypothetical protein
LRAGIVVVLGRRLLLLHKLWTGLLPLNDEFAVMLVRLAKVVGRRLKAGKGRSVVAWAARRRLRTLPRRRLRWVVRRLRLGGHAG